MAGILILYEALPDALLTAIDEDAKSQDISPYDVVRQILSDRYRLLTFGSTSSYRPAGVRFKLRVDPKLRKKIDMEAARTNGTIRGVVLSALASHYGLAPIDSGRRPRSTA